LRQLRVLLLRLGLKELELLLDLVHVRLKRKPKVVLVLAEHGDQLLVVGLQAVRYLLKHRLHLVDIVLECVD